MPRSAQFINSFNAETDNSDLLEEALSDMFSYHKWTQEQEEAGASVRLALQRAAETILIQCPPGPDRTVAIRKIREARMDANSAITHGGRY